jgi:hypothetical protein
VIGAGGGNGPPAPPRGGRGRTGGPMTREELQRLREEELANQHHGKGRSHPPLIGQEDFNTNLLRISILSTKRGFDPKLRDTTWYFT